jgi:hypothetical protein
MWEPIPLETQDVSSERGGARKGPQEAERAVFGGTKKIRKAAPK